MSQTLISPTISRDDRCHDCGHEKYDHDAGRCGQCECTNRFTCSGCGHDWFHHHFDRCEGGFDCPCDRKPEG